MMSNNSGDRIFTFGYGNRTNYDDFLKHLNNFNVACVVDIRISPRAWTRKWYGDRIKTLCDDVGVQYVSEVALGNTSGTSNWIPKDSKAAENALVEISKIAKSKNVMLLCAEKDSLRCHRTKVANCLQEKIGLPIQHLI